MNKTRVSGVFNVGLGFLTLAVVVMATANIPADYSLPKLIDNIAGASQNDVAAGESIHPEYLYASETFKSGWRYTKNGWQNLTDWNKPESVDAPALHPAVLGSLQLLTCLAVLVVFSGRK